MSTPSNLPDLAKLGIDDDVDDDLFASPSASAATQKPPPPPPTAGSTPSSSSAQKQPHARAQSRHEAEQAREAQLQVELARVREVNRVVEGVTASLTKAQGNLATVQRTVDNASALLATWTRILSQTEHNQRLLLSPGWPGASRDLAELEAEERRRQQEAERRALDEQRRREEALRRAEDDERRKAAAAAAPASGTGRGVNRTRSLRGAAGSTRGYTGVGGQAGRGRGAASTRGTGGAGRGSSTTRGRGRGLG